MNIINIEIPKTKLKPYGFIEFWNPTKEQLFNLVPYLIENDTFAMIWVYGEPSEIHDYSFMDDLPLEEKARLSQPYWLARTAVDAFKVRTMCIQDIFLEVDF